jgi:hypothetical protein
MPQGIEAKTAQQESGKTLRKVNDVRHTLVNEIGEGRNKAEKRINEIKQRIADQRTRMDKTTADTGDQVCEGGINVIQCL